MDCAHVIDEEKSSMIKNEQENYVCKNCGLLIINKKGR